MSLDARHSSLLNLASSSHYGSRYNTDDEDDDFGEISKMMETDTKKEVITKETQEAAQRKKKKWSTEQEEEAEGKPPGDREGEANKTQPTEEEGKKKERNKEKKAKKTTPEGGGRKAHKERKKDKAPFSSATGEESTMEVVTMATTTVMETQHKLVKGEVEMKNSTHPPQEVGEETVTMSFGVGSMEDSHAQERRTRTPPTRVKEEVKDKVESAQTTPSSVGVSKGKSPLVKRRMYVQQDHQRTDGSPVLTTRQMKEFQQQDLEEREGQKKPVTVSAKVSLTKVSAEHQVHAEEQVVVNQTMHAMDVVMETAPSPKGDPSKMKKQSVELVLAEQHKEPSYVAEVVIPKDAEVEEKVQQFSFESDEEVERHETRHAEKQVQRQKVQSDKLEAEEVRTQEVHQPHPQEVVKPETTVVQQEPVQMGSEGVEGSKEKEKKKKKKKKTSEQVEEEPPKSKGKKKKTSTGGEKKKSSSKLKDGAAPPATSAASSTAPPWASGMSLPMFNMGMETHPTLDQPPEDSSLTDDIFGELAKSSSVGDILKDIEDQIREMETGLNESPSSTTQPPSAKTAQTAATPAQQSSYGRNEQSPFEGTIHDLARELEKLGESELGSVSTTTTQSAAQRQQAQAARRRMAQQEVKVQQTQTIIEDSLVQKLVEVNRTLTEGGESLSSWDLVQLQQEHNQLVQMVITQALSARETGLDTQALAQGIAAALHQLDHFTISQIMGGINQGSKWSIQSSSGTVHMHH